MGYTTEFTGRTGIVPPLEAAEIAYLQRFSETRRMKRAFGPYFVDGSGDWGQGDDGDIDDLNCPPDGQPGLWCNWAPTPDGAALTWNGVEKFYCAAEWMTYLVDHFLKPGGEASSSAAFEGFRFDHVLNGVIHAQGEDPDDVWQLVVIDNRVHAVAGDTEIPETDRLLAQIDEVLHDASVSSDAMRSRPVA